MNAKALLPMGFLFVLIAAGPAALFVAGQPDGPGAKMAAAAVAFLDSLDEAQSKKARFAFDDAERTNWHFVPNIYPGVPFSDLSSGQKRAVHRLLHTVLSGSGYHKTTTIMKLEDTLREFAEAAGRKAPHRDPGRYSVSFYGDPSKKSPWGFRLQGHHISWNFSLIDGRIAASTPAFLGANPAEVQKGAHAGLRALPEEEDMARDLLAMFTDEQRDATILNHKAPRDVLWGPGKMKKVIGKERRGLSLKAMTGEQRELAWDLVRVYVRNLKPAVAKEEIRKIREAGLNEIHFAWMGSTKRGEGHYYRLHGPTFAIEYDNTQNGANHVHTVWHDLTNDFATDLLRQHYEKHHKKK